VNKRKLNLYENNTRVMIDSLDFADHLYQRVKDFIPPTWNQRERACLNERLRFLRYHKGEYFGPHFDGEYRRDDGERSYITLMLYLNEGFEGGNTTFLDMNSEARYEVNLQTGMVLLFQHDIFHEGSLLKGGAKYCMRTDVMYSKSVTSREKCDELNKKWKEEQEKRAVVTTGVIENEKVEEKTKE